jgi:hypothetical protein
MEAISDLNSLRRTSRRATDILWAAVASDNLNTGMLLEPRFEYRGAPLGQQIDRTSLFQVEQNGSIALAFAERKIINAKDTWRNDRWSRDLPYEAQ